jgi:pilus assembly protein CpaB
MGSNRVIILVVAAAAAIVLMLIVRGIAGHHPAPTPVAAAPSQPVTNVLVAHRDLPTGTRLAAGDVVWQPWPADALNPAFITDGHAAQAAPSGAVAALARNAATAVASAGPMEAVYGAVVRVPILVNEPIVQTKLVRSGEGGYMAVVLHPGMRAVAIPIGVSTAAGGFILPGDHVDVLQAKQAGEGPNAGHDYTAQTLLQNVEVLAIDQASSPTKGAQAMVGGVATLEVPAADAEVLAVAKAQGEVVLALRSYADAGGRSGRAVAAARQSATGEVHIFRGGVMTNAMVTP